MESDIEILEEEKSAAERERDRFAHKVKNLEQENNELKETIYDERTGINEVETRLKAENERVKEENGKRFWKFLKILTEALAFFEVVAPLNFPKISKTSSFPVPTTRRLSARNPKFNGK